jgi:hypothetical protein
MHSREVFNVDPVVALPLLGASQVLLLHLSCFCLLFFLWHSHTKTVSNNHLDDHATSWMTLQYTTRSSLHYDNEKLTQNDASVIRIHRHPRPGKSTRQTTNLEHQGIARSPSRRAARRIITFGTLGRNRC